MKKILIKALFIVILFSGCSTTPVKMAAPPRLNRLEVLKKSVLSEDPSALITQNESEELAKDYLLAMKAEKENNLKMACHLFTNLSENNNFAIKDAALVHTLADCDLTETELIHVWKNAAIPSYLKEAYTEESLKWAIKKNLLEFEAQFSFALINFKKVQAEKLKLIKRSIDIAKKLGDADRNKIYNDRLKEISPLYETALTNQNIFTIAKDFETNRQFEKARLLYKQIIDGQLSIDEKVKAYNAFRISYKIERNLKSFLQKTFEMEEFLKSEMQKDMQAQKTIEHWVDSKIALVKAVWTDHQNQKARQLLDELIATKLGNTNQLANIHLVYGSLHLESKENTEALKCFEKAGDFKVTDAALKENIQWAIVWNHYLLKQDSNVVSNIDAFIKKSTNQDFIAKLNYWKARSLQRLHKAREADELFAKVFSSNPFDYYGIISAIDLQAPLPPLTSSVIDTGPTGLHILDWLIAMEEKNYSQKYLKEINSQFKTPKERERAMSLYLQTEWYQGGMRQIYNFKMNSRNAMTQKYINIVFPTPYFNFIEKFAHKYNVPRELIWSITKQESAFVPSERSWADAFGLMQMIPEKASELSKKYKMSYKDYNDLYGPEKNLEIGTALLSDLRTKFNSKFIQSVAAYNANEKVIGVWEKERFNGDFIEFIEMIPYEETRNYIKLVFRNFITYKRITSKEEFIINKDFFASPF